MTLHRFALIGCSGIAKKHAESLRRIEGAELAAVCDLNPSRAEEMGRAYGVPHYTRYEEMLRSEPIDVVSVLTPSGDHARRVLDLVQYRKHIVVEKPMALRLEDADEMVEACAAAGVRLFVVKQNRYNRPVQALRKALEAGRFGKLVLATVRVRWCRTQEYYAAAPWRGTWEHDGGVLTNQASHHVDLLTWMAGEVEKVSAMTSTRLVDIETEDVATATLRFRNGALGIIEATTATRPKDLEGSVSILGEKGSVVIGGFAMDRLLTWAFSEPQPEDARIFETHGENPGDFAWSHTEYLRGVVRSLQGKEAPLVHGLEGKKSIALIHALYESAETDRTVSLPCNPQRSRLGQKSEPVSADVLIPRRRAVQWASRLST